MNVEITRYSEELPDSHFDVNCIVIHHKKQVFRFYSDRGGLRVNADDAILVSPQAANSLIFAETKGTK